MKLANVLPEMSKLYLRRVVNSILRDVTFEDEDEMREAVLRNTAEFQNEERVKKNLDFLAADRTVEVLNELILHCLTQAPEYLSTYPDLIAAVEKLEEKIVADSEDVQYVSSAIPKFAGQVYGAVLTAAWKKDESLNAHEKNVLEVLRSELGLTRQHHRLIESRAGRFPQKGNRLFAHKSIDEALKDLQVRGIVLRFKTDVEYFVIPEEVAHIVRYEKGEELKAVGYETLLQRLRVDQLRSILSEHQLSTSGTKEVLVGRIQRFTILPSWALATLGTADLAEILRGLEGARISGSKEERIVNIIDYFENVASPTTTDPTDERAVYYDVFEQLASRDYKSLRASGVVSKDIEVEHYFEEATRYLFEKMLGMPLMEMPGSAHADGRLKVNSKEVLLWDNKSTERPYAFPDEHIEQFLNYIRADVMRPTVFIVIVYDYTPGVVNQAQRLKSLSDTDTDVALIKASDLKYVAENWRSLSKMKEPSFNLQVFNLTGGLDRETLKNRMSWML